MPYYDFALTGGDVLLGDGELRRLNVGVCDGRIETLTAAAIEAGTTLDVSGLTVLPGVVDQHYHCWWGYGFESHASSTRAAIKGGVTTVIEMPLDRPLTLTVEAWEAKQASVADQYHVDHAVIGGYLEEAPEELDAMADAGVVAYKLFTGLVAPPGMYPGSDDAAVLYTMRRAREHSVTVIVHCEDASIVDAETARLRDEGRNDPRAWDEARSWLAEVDAVQRVALIAEATGARTVIAHVPTPRSVEAVTAARARGADVWVETCPHQICLSQDDMALDTRLKWNPPTRDRAQVERLWEQLAAGEVHAIGSDHAPLPKIDGADIWDQNPGAGNVLETMLPVVATEALSRGVGLARVAELLCATPARLFGLYPRKGVIAVGSDADFAVVSTGAARTIRAAELEWHDEDGRWTPYEGRTVTVDPVYTVLRGKLVYAKGEVLGEPGDGELVLRG
jgi:dihydroorotase (multifunctional complex type)